LIKAEITREDALRQVNILQQRVIELEAIIADKSLKSVPEPNYQAMFESANDVILLMDTKGKITDVNNKLKEILGYERDKLLNKNFDSLTRTIKNENLEKIVKNFAKRMVGQTVKPYEVEMVKRNGETVTLEVNARAIVKENKIIGDIAILRDITERKKAEDDIRESRARFRELARLLPLAVWEADENGIVTYTNEETIKTYGYSYSDVSPSHYLQNLVPADRNRAAQNAERIVKGETLRGIEYTALRKDGSTFPVRIYASAITKNGKNMGLRGITLDITEQKLAQKRLEQAAQEWRATFDSLTDMVCILDGDFKISRLNMALAKIFKKEPKDLLGSKCYELMNRDCPCQDCPHQKTLQTEKPARAEFYEPALATFIEVSTSPIFDENGRVKATVHIMRDISERKQMEQQLLLTDRLASVGELASGVAHELNNPLTSVIGFSQLLMEEEVPDNIKEDLSLINSEAQRAAAVVKNLLTFARKHSAVKQPTRINNLIEDVLKLRAYEQKVNNIEIIKKLAPDLPEIMVDYFQIQQVFLNIIINAEFFMIEDHKRGVLTITTEKTSRFIRISFSDDGPGISKENLNRIFNPFFTTKEVGKGTGLGLSICHGIITDHRGVIHAESEAGKGATFIIELPINES
jgi:PAS domain S-box-containing protein